MTKSLTEQWKDGKLENGYYWCRILDNEKEAFMQHLIAGHFQYSPSFIKEVLAPVPSYKEWKELKDFKQRAVDDSTTNPLDCMQIEINGLEDYIKKLEQQLAEANELVKECETKSNAYVCLKAQKYFDKWDVK